MTIVVTGATGHFGRHVVEALLAKGVPADQIVATGRNVDKIADLGVTVKRAAYEDPASLREAFAGADKVLLVSGTEFGSRVRQHANAIQAAKEAGVRLIVYTSAPKADTTDMRLAEEHLGTERVLAESGVPYVILRNSWYIENYNLEQALEHGLFGAAGDGKIAGAPRADYAEAAAAVLTGEGHEGQVYELGGDAFTLAELAAEITRQSGKQVSYTDLGEEKYAEMLIGVGVPAAAAAILADSDSAASRGALFVEPTHLEQLLGRPVTPLATAIRNSLS
jgi:NAD(P)H dehydrogenase (quinone)